MPENVRVVVGQVAGTHGIRGEIRIRPLTDYPERFFEMETLRLYRRGEPAGSWNVRGMRELEGRGMFLASLEGVDDMDAAEQLRGCTIEIDPAERVQLPENEFWISDLAGLDALDESGTRLGVVKDVVDSGASQLLVITDDNGRDHYIPAVPEFFRSADLQSRTVTIRLIDGLWEL
ncbi:MAG: 16S rRNA processing protein RimM [Pyramidobacter sp.]|nr:16S rRNA processing protein RimM [Pyramidobacter sp.]